MFWLVGGVEGGGGGGCTPQPFPAVPATRNDKNSKSSRLFQFGTTVGKAQSKPQLDGFKSNWRPFCSPTEILGDQPTIDVPTKFHVASGAKLSKRIPVAATLRMLASNQNGSLPLIWFLDTFFFAGRPNLLLLSYPKTKLFLFKKKKICGKLQPSRQQKMRRAVNKARPGSFEGGAVRSGEVCVKFA